MKLLLLLVLVLVVSIGLAILVVQPGDLHLLLPAGLITKLIQADLPVGTPKQDIESYLAARGYQPDPFINPTDRGLPSPSGREGTSSLYSPLAYQWPFRLTADFGFDEKDRLVALRVWRGWYIIEK